MSVPDSSVEQPGRAIGPTGPLSASNSAIDELTTRLRATAGSARPAAPQRSLLASGARRYAIPALVTMAVLSAAVFFGVRMWPTAGEAARTLASRVASTLPLLRNAIAGDPAPADEPEQPSAPAGPRRPRRSVQPQPPLVSRQPLAPAIDAPKVLIEGPPTPPVAAIEEPYDPIIYSNADPEVAPPKARLVDVSGTAFDVRRRPRDTLELLVNEQGIVEHATLHTRDPQMLDSMLLSRVKAWRFDPARRQGHAVAYRLLLVWNGSHFEPGRLLSVAEPASR